MRQKRTNPVDIQGWHRKPILYNPYMFQPFSGDEVLQWARGRVRETVDLIGEMVRRESPSDDAQALERFASWFAETAGREFGARVSRTEEGHLLCTLGPLNTDSPPFLLLGHYDTVWPVGTLARMEFKESNGRLWGPGVLDMKGGIALALMALRAVSELAAEFPAPVLLQLNADEETGSRTSRALTEFNARKSRCVLVIEPGTGLDGKLKTARKGIGDFTLHVKGRAAHAGVDFEQGASAVLEMARQILIIAGFTDLERGITVNPGVVRGGSRSNVIAADAEVHVDMRVARVEDVAGLENRFRSLQPVDPRCSIRVTGGLNRPPMQRTPAIGRLFETARRIGTGIGIELNESATGGGSDGNFTAALGIPTLDGLGAVGEGAHAVNESILIDRIADRIALLAGLITST